MTSVYITDVIRAYKRAPLTFVLNVVALTLGVSRSLCRALTRKRLPRHWSL